MDFRSVKRTILETDSCDTLPLAPSTLAIAPEFPDGARQRSSPRLGLRRQARSPSAQASMTVLITTHSANAAYQPRRALRAVGCMRLFDARMS